MVLFGASLYLILFIFVLYFVRCARGKSLDDLFAAHDRAHHRVQQIIEKHPTGGTWAQYLGWTKEEGGRDNDI